MRRSWRITVWLCGLLLPTFTSAAEHPVAIVNARIHTVASDKPLEKATLIIRNGKIASVGRQASVPEDAEVIEAGDLTVTPAFMNSGTQLGLTEIGSVSETIDSVTGNDVLGASFDIQYALNPRSALFLQARADGLSRAISYPGASDGAIYSGLGASLWLEVGSPSIDRARVGLFVEVGGKDDGSRADQWLRIRQSLDSARERRSRRQAPQTQESLWLARDLEVLATVADGQLPLVVTAQRESDIRQAIALAGDYGIRVILMGAAESWAAADSLAAARIPVILDPTLNLPLYFDQLRARDDTAAILQKSGVLVAFRVSSIHTSFNAAYSLREAAGIAVSNGLSHASALKAVTVNPATIWGVADRYGVIARGRDADLVVWDGDPFEPASAPVIVFIEGRRASLETRQTALRDRYIQRIDRSATGSN